MHIYTEPQIPHLPHNDGKKHVTTDLILSYYYSIAVLPVPDVSHHLMYVDVETT